MKHIRTAVIGAGFIGPVHVEALKRLGVPIAGILGVDDAESSRAAETLGLPRAYRSFDEILRDDGVQAVHITTPNRFHFEMASKALRAGKHVLCEKPLAMNSRESAALVKLARQTRLAAGVNYNIRFYPLCLEARDIVRRGDLGEVFSVCGSYAQDWLLLPTDYNWRVLAREGGALRAIADIGTHWLDLMRAITGLEVEAVCADLKTVHPVRQRPKGEVQTFKGKEEKVAATEPVKVATEDFGGVLLRFRGGARGVLWVSQVTAGRKNCLRFEIAGAKSALYWDSEEPNTMWIGHRGRPNESLIRDPALVSDAARRFINYPGGHAEGFPDTFKQCFKAFYSYIAAGDFSAPPTFPTFADGHREIALCEAILQSHRQNKWVRVKA
ncbi:MAG: Gfo/Idh/MocA family oxidoreductase [Verrucomicrobiae bacterium]|nr:Gfo/Idh/MocA family oxidoreductase [Verrucomicrobiae bacterium]